MKRFKNILVVTSGKQAQDGENLALQQACKLAVQNQARVTLMDVISEPAQALKTYSGIVSAKEITDIFVDSREKTVNKMVEDVEKQGIKVDTKIVIGRDFIEIIRQILRGKHDLLIKPANEHPGNFDSSDFHLMRKCPVPLWLIKPRQNQNNHNIVAAIDVTLQDTDEGKQLNRLIMDLSTSLARWQHCHLDIVSCWSLFGEDTLRHSAFLKIPAAQLDSLLGQEKASCQQQLRRLMADYNQIAMTEHVIKGDPKTCIAEFVRKNNSAIVVMGTVGRTGIPGLLIGNTAETVLQNIDTSVLTVKPNGFETPVTLN